MNYKNKFQVAAFSGELTLTVLFDEIKDHKILGVLGNSSMNADQKGRALSGKTKIFDRYVNQALRDLLKSHNLDSLASNDVYAFVDDEKETVKLVVSYRVGISTSGRKITVR